MGGLRSILRQEERAGWALSLSPPELSLRPRAGCVLTLERLTLDSVIAS